MSISPWLGGDPAQIALRMAGRTLSYGELRALVDAYDLPAGALVRAPNHDPLTLLVAVLAALHQQRAVLICAPEHTAPLPLVVPDGTALVVLTSGSVGHAKSIARTADSWRDSFAPFTHATGIRPDDRIALSGPLHVSMHLFAALHTLWIGAELTDAMSDATAVHCTPAVLARLLSSPRMPQRAVVAGAALPVAVRAMAESRNVTVIEYYGAAELSFVAISQPTEAGASALRAFDGVEIDLRDGVLWARSPYLALGYLGSALPGALVQSDDGFATVGDIAEIDKHGVLQLRGRGDSAVTTAGSTVLSEEIERALDGIAGVRAAAVIAEPHPVLGEIVVAVVELQRTANTDIIRAEAATLLSAVERPRRWLAVAQLPRTASGKLAKGELRAGLASGALPSHEFAATDRGATHVKATDIGATTHAS